MKKSIKSPYLERQRGFTLSELIIAIAGILMLAIVAGVVGVVVHFIIKFW